VLDSFWSAWGVVAGARSYRHAIERAVRLGHDTDTTAAIAGGLAGLRWGVAEATGGIPAEWLKALRGKDLVEPLVARLG
jgi:ADP-ribosylglycohydrolase